MSEAGKLVALIFKETADGGVIASRLQQGEGVAVSDPDPHKAIAALEEIRQRAKEAGVELKDAVIAFRRRDGRIKIQQTRDLTTGKGAGRGGLLGLLVGLVFGGPLLGALLGLGIGALIGKRTDHGLDDEFIGNVSQSLKPTDSALLLLIDQELTQAGMEYLRSFDAELYVTDISEEAHAAVSRVAEDKAISQAEDAEFSSD